MRDERRTSKNLGDEDDDDETSVDIEQPFVLFSGSATSKQGYQTDYYTFNTAVGWGRLCTPIIPRTMTEMERLL